MSELSLPSGVNRASRLRPPTSEFDPSEKSARPKSKADCAPFLSRRRSQGAKLQRLPKGVVLVGGTCDGGNSSSSWVARWRGRLQRTPNSQNACRISACLLDWHRAQMTRLRSNPFGHLGMRCERWDGSTETISVWTIVSVVAISPKSPPLRPSLWRSVPTSSTLRGCPQRGRCTKRYKRFQLFSRK